MTAWVHRTWTLPPQKTQRFANLRQLGESDCKLTQQFAFGNVDFICPVLLRSCTINLPAGGVWLVMRVGGSVQDDTSGLPVVHLETNSHFAPENRPSRKETRKYSNHPFSGVNSLLGRVYKVIFYGFYYGKSLKPSFGEYFCDFLFQPPNKQISKLANCVQELCDHSDGWFSLSDWTWVMDMNHPFWPGKEQMEFKTRLACRCVSFFMETISSC